MDKMVVALSQMCEGFCHNVRGDAPEGHRQTLV